LSVYSIENFGRFKKGHIPWNKGKEWSEEIITKISKSRKGQVSGMKGKHHSEETKLKIRLNKLGKPSSTKGIKRKPLSKELRKRLSEIHKNMSNTGRFKKGMVSWSMGLTKKNNYSLRRISKKAKVRMKRLWKDPEYVARQMKSHGVKPNKLEKYFEKFLNKLCPNEWKYVGDGQLIINGKCPDFVNVNGKKKLIELYGNYWHRGQDPEVRKNIFKEFGWDTLIIWEKDIRKNPYLKNTVNNFIHDRKLHRREVTKEINK